ncbi:MAG TPA: hypothetical protein DDY20_11265 [Desulfobulbaceae bacterium]|nr:hypothetical protein [Desulfobulbaceae bacterium]
MKDIPDPPDPHIAEHHLFSRLGKTILFNCETMLFYEVTPVVSDLVSLLSQESPPEDPVRLLQAKYAEEEIKKAVYSLRQEQFLRDTAPPKPSLVKRRGIRHLELMLTHECNMRCRYCYGVQGDGDWQDAPYLYGAHSKGMSFETARLGVDFLFAASGPQKKLSVIFFGGEPLLELDLMGRIARYVRQREGETGKTARLSLSTNGLLLSAEAVAFCERNRISCQVSMDGEREAHNRNRVLRNGSGSYDAILPGVKRLLAARPGNVSVRATITRANLDLLHTVRHLHDLGFGSVHAEPAIGPPDGLNVTADEVPILQEQHEEVARFLVRSARENRYFNYTNLVKFIRHTSEVKERQAHYCGAARTYLALAQDGSFYPCHRFVGLEEYRMGDLRQGFDDRLQRTVLNLTVDARPVCRECWARYLCGGGCWHHALTTHGTLTTPDSEVSCLITRHLVECAMAVSSDLQELAKTRLSRMYETSSEPYLVAEHHQQLED